MSFLLDTDTCSAHLKRPAAFAHRMIEYSKCSTSSEAQTMIKTLQGKVHGRTIELTEESGLKEGQDVEVSLRELPDQATAPTGEGFLRTEGALADDPEWEAIMEAVYRDRKNDSRREILD